MSRLMKEQCLDEGTRVLSLVGRVDHLWVFPALWSAQDVYLGYSYHNYRHTRCKTPPASPGITCLLSHHLPANTYLLYSDP